MNDHLVQPLVLRDPISSLTHLASAIATLYVTLLLRRLTRHDRIKRRSLTVFGVSMIVLYGFSGLYHAINLPKATAIIDFFRRCDHSAIYGLIAGTYTPILAVLLARTWARQLLPWVWGGAALGIAAKWAFPFAPHTLTVALYLALGWVGVLVLGPMLRTIGLGGVGWLALGGALYTVGSICEVLAWPIVLDHWFGPHEVLHVCDMGGTAAHTVLMLRYVVPYRPTSRRGVGPGPLVLPRISALVPPARHC